VRASTPVRFVLRKPLSRIFCTISRYAFTFGLFYTRAKSLARGTVPCKDSPRQDLWGQSSIFSLIFRSWGLSSISIPKANKTLTYQYGRKTTDLDRRKAQTSF
jgi:hypothetical protein